MSTGGDYCRNDSANPPLEQDGSCPAHVERFKSSLIKEASRVQKRTQAFWGWLCLAGLPLPWSSSGPY